ncbi:MAG: hypothetical protein WCK57_07110 [Verrucomicrobiae bacterium]
MRKTLIQIFGLSPVAGTNEVTDAQITAAAADLKARADAATVAAQKEKAINELVTQSIGALTRDAAKEILEQRAASAVK